MICGRIKSEHREEKWEFLGRLVEALSG